jgi:hypothetical protein
MKRSTWSVAIVVASICTPVYAAEHLMKINELLRSKNADSTVQFVELLDLNAAGESFPNGPYKLEVFDANGVSLGVTTMTITPTPAHGRYIATPAADTAFMTTRQDTLATSLPENGQACFENNAAVNNKIACLAWGCITTAAQVGIPRAPTPPDGMSIQRQTDGTYQVAVPTPNAANIAGTSMAACPTDPMDGPPDAGVKDAPGNPNNGDAGVNNPNNGGCCNVDGRRGMPGAFLLALGTLVVLRRRR